MKKLTSAGFAIPTAAIAIAIILAIGAIAWRVGVHDNKPAVSHSNKPTLMSGIHDASKPGWKTFYDQRDKLAFDFPASWKVASLRHADSLPRQDTNGPYVYDTITSPSGAIELTYADYTGGVDGIGCGSTEPGLNDFPCPVIHITALSDITKNFPASNMKFVEKITYWKGTSERYVPAFGLYVPDNDTPQSIGSSQQADFYMRTDFSGNGGIFAYNWAPAPNTDSKAGFATYKDASLFLAKPETVTAKQIIQSVRPQKT